MNALIALLCIMLIVGFLGALGCLLAEAYRFYQYEMKAWRWRRVCQQWQKWGGL